MKSDKTNLISILMTVHNEENYIEEAIKSILLQTYDNFELIIIDDGSDDNTYKIAEKYLNDKRVFLHQLEKIGKINAFNLAFSKSSGDFFCFFAGDDILPKDSIENRVNPINDIIKDPAISFCKMKTFSEIKKFNGIIMPRKSSRGSLSGGSMMFNKQFANLTFPIPPVLENEDMWQVLHTIYFNNIIVKHIPKIGINYRIHINNSSNKMISFKEKNESMHKRFGVYNIFLEKYRNLLNEDQINSLSVIIQSETLRYNGSWLTILSMRNLQLIKKIRFIMYSNRIFYFIRKKLFSFFSGWE